MKHLQLFDPFKDALAGVGVTLCGVVIILSPYCHLFEVFCLDPWKNSCHIVEANGDHCKLS